MQNESVTDLVAPDPVAISAAALRTLVDGSADGLVLLDEHGVVCWLNPAARRALEPRADHPDLSRLVRDLDPSGRPGGVRRTTWVTPRGRRRHLDYRSIALDDGGTALWLSDVTEPVRQQERITGITRAAASVADTYSLRATLDAVASEIARTAGISAVQIHAFTDPRAEIRVLGMAGFGDATNFTERLAECRALGVRMLSIESFTRGERMVSPHRKAAVMSDPKWAPLHEIMSRPDWDTFVAVPLCVRGRVLGALNAYYEPGEDPGAASLSFLEAMADHAAVAMDTAALLKRTRSRARSDERRRLARDLLDSAVQQVFSMRMQTEALLARLEGDTTGSAGDRSVLRGRVEELSALAANALVDLRALLSEMRPFDLAPGGLIEALRAGASEIETRHGLLVEVIAPDAVEVDIEVQEDVFRVVQEALHNVVKHATATSVAVRFHQPTGRGSDWVVEVADDGRTTAQHSNGSTGMPGGGLGLISMQERAEGWGGYFRAGPAPEGGWLVQAFLPAGLVKDEA